MSVRNVRLRPAFDRSLKKLSRKHRSLAQDVPQLLEQISRNGPTRNSDRIERLGGLPVFKVRVRIAGMSQRGSARVIYFCDDRQVIGLFLFAKGDRENVPQKEILDALEAVGLEDYPDDEDS